MPTRLWDVQAYLVSTFADAVGQSVTVFKGPRTRSAAPKRFILVGTDGGLTGLGDPEDGLTADQEPSSMGPGTWRSESGTITCSAWVWSGSDIDTCREAVRQLLDQCEQAIDTDPTLGGITRAAEKAGVTTISSREQQTENGPYVRVVFTVSYGALITEGD